MIIMFSISIQVQNDTEYNVSSFCYGPMQVISSVISFHASLSLKNKIKKIIT